MKTSIATVSISGDLREKLAAIAAAGFDGVEIFENDFLAFDGSPAEVGRMVRDHGLEITLFQPFRDFEGMPEPQRSRAFDRAERKFDLMGELGTDLMLVCSNVSPAALGGIDRAADDFQALGERAAKRGLRVGYEALAWGRHISDHRDAWEIVRRAEPSEHRADPRLLPYAGPAGRCRDDPRHPRRSHLHRPARRRAAASRWTCCTGAGTSATCRVRAICRWSTSCARSLRPATTGRCRSRYSTTSSAADRPDRSRSMATGRLSTSWTRWRAPSRDIAIDVPAMPERVTVSGVEFVEFAANETEAEELAVLLRTMGFSLVGRHKNKDVVLFRQGGINIVVNTEKEGLAHSSYLVHGTSAYAFGLKVDDAAATVARARALGAEPFEQRHGPDELSIPAIRGVGGGVIYFIDGKSELARVWEIEFEPVGEAGRRCRPDGDRPPRPDR